MIGCNLDIIRIPEDIHTIYSFMNADDQYLYSTKLHFQSEMEFEKWLISRLANDFHDFYVIRSDSDGKPLGYVHNYDFSLVDGHYKLVVYICPNYRSTGIGGIAAVKFMKKLFSTYPLQKVYSTIYEYNKESLKSNLAAGFIKEGVLKDYRYYNGTWHDIYYLSITRSQFDRTLGRLVK